MTSNSQSKKIVKGLLMHKLRAHDNKPSEIIPNLFLGSSGSIPFAVEELNIRFILRCAPGLGDYVPSSIDKQQHSSTNSNPAEKNVSSTDKKSKKLNIIYKDLNMRDAGEFKTLSDALNSDTYAFIDQGRECGGVLICCLQGKSRSVSVTVGYLSGINRMKTNDRSTNVTVDEALDLVKEKRPAAKPNMGFVLCLKKMERERDAALDGVGNNGTTNTEDVGSTSCFIEIFRKVKTRAQRICGG